MTFSKIEEFDPESVALALFSNVGSKKGNDTLDEDKSSPKSITEMSMQLATTEVLPSKHFVNMMADKDVVSPRPSATPSETLSVNDKYFDWELNTAVEIMRRLSEEKCREVRERQKGGLVLHKHEMLQHHGAVTAVPRLSKKPRTPRFYQQKHTPALGSK